MVIMHVAKALESDDEACGLTVVVALSWGKPPKFDFIVFGNQMLFFVRF